MGRALTPEATHAALQVLSKFRRLAESHKVDEILAVARVPLAKPRRRRNSCRQLRGQTGIRPRVISGTEEARLIHLAAVYGVGATADAAVVIDIGGGSVEVTRGAGPVIEVGRSFKLGVIRLTERFVKSDPLERRDERKLVRHIEEEVGRYLNQIVRAGFDRVIGTSGTILSLGAVASAADGRPIARRFATAAFPAKQVRRTRKQLLALDLEERMRVPGLEPRRADLAVAGAILLDELLRRLGAQEITLCDLSLREGLVLDYISRHRKEIAQADRYPTSAAEASSSSPTAANTGRITRSTSRASPSGCSTRRARSTGSPIASANGSSTPRSCTTSACSSATKGTTSTPYYLVKNGDLRGFEPEEIETIALVARYHRQGTPKRRHEGLPRSAAPDAAGPCARCRRCSARPRASIAATRRASPASRSTIRGEDDLLQLRTTGDASSSSGPPRATPPRSNA
jgi:exopolyphosphatase/guanosine-5'-triphosphate,3'-diphosphate pyrophosphatase